MARRLNLTRPPLGDSRLLPDVPRPDLFTAGSCTLARALMALCAHRERVVGYDAIMGLCGMAFSLPVTESFLPADSESLRCSDVPAGLETLGLDARLWTGSPDAPPLADAARSAIDAGFAVPVLGWPEGESGWGIVSGYDLGRGVLCGWPQRVELDSYLGAAPAGSLAVICRGTRVPSPKPEAIERTLARVAANSEALGLAYEKWCTSIDERWERDPEHPDSLDRVLGHERLTEGLADSRAAAARFLRRAADVLGGVRAEWLLAVAETCDELSAAVEMRQPPLLSDKMPKALATGAWRSRWREQIGHLWTLDLQIAANIGRALTSDLGPDELIL